MNAGKHSRGSMLVVLLLAAAVMLAACGNEAAPEATQPSGEKVDQTVGSTAESTDVTQLQQELVTIQTQYLSLSYPETYADVLLHQEVTADAVTMEIFSMKADNRTLELFRIFFGDETVGSIAGYLSVDGQEIPVTYTICQYNDEEFTDEETRAQYYETMNCLNDIMGTLEADDCFQTEKKEHPVENTETVLTYWTVTLPETMEYEEFEENGLYKVACYGNVAGERIALYTIYIGDPGAETVLGTYDVNGEAKKLSVESYEIIPAESWTDEEQASAYAMMATVNDVIQTIMSSENFSEEIPE